MIPKISNENLKSRYGSCGERLTREQFPIPTDKKVAGLPVHGAGHHVGHRLCRIVDHRHPAQRSLDKLEQFHTFMRVHEEGINILFYLCKIQNIFTIHLHT